MGTSAQSVCTATQYSTGPVARRLLFLLLHLHLWALQLVVCWRFKPKVRVFDARSLEFKGVVRNVCEYGEEQTRSF